MFLNKKKNILVGAVLQVYTSFVSLSSEFFLNFINWKLFLNMKYLKYRIFSSDLDMCTNIIFHIHT